MCVCVYVLEYRHDATERLCLYIYFIHLLNYFVLLFLIPFVFALIFMVVIVVVV